MDKQYKYTYERTADYCYKGTNVLINKLNFTDDEYRILLSALSRERQVCKKVDNECEGDKNLTMIMDSIERKIKAVQYKQGY